MNKIRIISVGCGQRGHTQTYLLGLLDEYEVVGLVDVHLDKAQKTANMLDEKFGIKDIPCFEDYKKAVEELKPQAALVSVDWKYHIEVATYLMEKGIAVGMEVGGIFSEEECWKLVDCYEKTKTPFMFLENCCYGKEELLATNIVRKGLLGEVVYCHGSYCHDLREEVSYGKKNRHYRLKEYINFNRENYPTHELGPIAKILNINRGNRMVSLVSVASKASGLKEYIKNKNDEDLEDLKGVEFKQGDVINTLITCENGEVISLKLNTTLPTYYTREFTVNGTKGLASMEHNIIFEDGKCEHDFGTHDFYAKQFNNAWKYYDKYLPKMWSELTKEMQDAGHGGIDYFELKAFANHLINNEEMPIDVYDAVAWGAITYLSELSIKNNGASIPVPDFTRGKYKNRQPKDVIDFN